MYSGRRPGGWTAGPPFPPHPSLPAGLVACLPACRVWGRRPAGSGVGVASDFCLRARVCVRWTFEGRRLNNAYSRPFVFISFIVFVFMFVFCVCVFCVCVCILCRGQDLFTPRDAETLIGIGGKRRTFAATALNSASSRSHCVVSSWCARKRQQTPRQTGKKHLPVSSKGATHNGAKSCQVKSPIRIDTLDTLPWVSFALCHNCAAAPRKFGNVILLNGRVLNFFFLF